MKIVPERSKILLVSTKMNKTDMRKKQKRAIINQKEYCNVDNILSSSENKMLKKFYLLRKGQENAIDGYENH